MKPRAVSLYHWGARASIPYAGNDCGYQVYAQATTRAVFVWI